VSAAARGASATAARTAQPASRLAFALTLLFVTVEYLRPQDWIGALARAPVAVAVAVPLLVCVAQSLRAGVLREPLVVVIGLLAAFSLAWTPFATNRFWAFETFKFLVLEGLAVVAIASFVDRPGRLRALLALLGVGFVVQALWALGHEGRGLTTHFGDENDLALGMNVALPFAVFGAFALRSRVARALLVVASGLFVAGVVTSDSRGGLVGLAATTGAVLVFARRRLAIGAALAAGVALLVALAPDSYWAEMRTMFDSNDATRTERIRHWEEAKAVWRDNALLGVGPGNVPWVIGHYENYDTKLTHSLAGRAVHSLYWTLLAEFGLAGVLLYGAFVVLLVRRCLAMARAPDPPGVYAHAWARAIPCSLVAWLASGLFLSVLYYPHLYFLAALALAIGALQAPAAARGEPADAAGRAPGRAWATPLRVASP
jgi:O-antigen ligase